MIFDQHLLINMLLSFKKQKITIRFKNLIS